MLVLNKAARIKLHEALSLLSHVILFCPIREEENVVEK
jgi:hypothetical protein